MRPKKAYLKYENKEYNQKVKLSQPYDADIWEAMENVRLLLLAIGYHPESIKEGFENMANLYAIKSGKVKGTKLEDITDDEEDDE